MNNNSNKTNSDIKSVRFEAVVNTYTKDLFRYGLWLTRNSDDAEDLVQQTYLRAWNAIDTLKDPAAIKSWLITILRRENIRRFEKKRPELTSIFNEDIDFFAQQEDNFSNLEALYLRDALTKIPNKYLEPLLLQVLYGYTCNEIGELMGITVGTVMTRVFRASKKLQLLLQNDNVVVEKGAIKEEADLAYAI